VPVLAKDSSNLTDRQTDRLTLTLDRIHLTKGKHIRKRQTHPLVRHKNYDRKGSVEKKNLVVNLKGLGAKTNRLAVNRQS
jgi:hypothetical protein